MNLSETQKKEITELIEHYGGPLTTIENLISTVYNKDELESKIRFIMSIRHVSKKTYFGNQTISDYFRSHKINIDLEK